MIRIVVHNYSFAVVVVIEASRENNQEAFRAARVDYSTARVSWVRAGSDGGGGVISISTVREEEGRVAFVFTLDSGILRIFVYYTEDL
jgi:hypothetical protein